MNPVAQKHFRVAAENLENFLDRWYESGEITPLTLERQLVSYWVAGLDRVR